jgi:FkbM family methyltransferase
MASISRLFAIASAAGTVRTLVDVGANDGADCLPVAERNPGIQVVAIEPTPALAEELVRKSAELPNMTVVQCAIGVRSGAAVLKIRKNSVHNSLREIQASEVTRARIPAASYDLEDEVVVPIRTLAEVCAEFGIASLDVLHVDAQGSDLDVLRSAGPLLATLRAGAIEVSSRLHLYANPVTRSDAIHFLVSNGMRVSAIEPADAFNYEQNIYFGPSSRSRRQRVFDARLKAARADASVVRLARRVVRATPVVGPSLTVLARRNRSPDRKR